MSGTSVSTSPLSISWWSPAVSEQKRIASERLKRSELKVLSSQACWEMRERENRPATLGRRKSQAPIFRAVLCDNLLCFSCAEIQKLSFEKTLWRNCSGEGRNGALYTLFSRLLHSFFFGCLVKIINSSFFSGLQPEIISLLINLSEQWINHLASKMPWNREARHDFLKPKLTYSNDLNCSCIDWLIGCQLYNQWIN